MDIDLIVERFNFIYGQKVEELMMKIACILGRLDIISIDRQLLLKMDNLTLFLDGTSWGWCPWVDTFLICGQFAIAIVYINLHRSSLCVLSLCTGELYTFFFQNMWSTLSLNNVSVTLLCHCEWNEYPVNSVTWYNRVSLDSLTLARYITSIWMASCTSGLTHILKKNGAATWSTW